MYTPLNNRVIVQKPNEKTTASGIILSEQELAAVFEFDVIEVSEGNTRFTGKTIVAERRHVIEFPWKKDGMYVGSIKVDDIIAIKD